MNFIRTDQYVEQSDDGRYSVCAVKTEFGWRFGAWRCGERDAHGRVPLANLSRIAVTNDAEMARQICRDDAAVMAFYGRRSA